MHTKNLALLAAVALAALTLSACGGSGSTSAPATIPPAASATTPAPAESTSPGLATEVVVHVENGEPVGGTQTVSVKHGDKVQIRVEVDAPQEIHLHGYDIEKEAAPGKPAVFDFTANLEGIFDVESHLKDAKLVKLVVNP